MAAARKNFVVEQGSYWLRTLIIKESENGPIVPLTGYSFKMQIRDPEIGGLLLSLEEGDGITVIPLDGKIDLEILDTVSSALSLNAKWSTIVELYQDGKTVKGYGPTYRYDLEVDNGAVVTKLLTGSICVVPEMVL
jgi:hypothetical protein